MTTTQNIINIFIPLVLAIMMIGLGLNLQTSDFKRIRLDPKPMLVGVIVQCLFLPFLALGLAVIFNLPPEYAIGLMLLSASPGGPSANLYSNLAGGDVALNVSLTAVNSLLSIVFIPFIVNFSYDFFLGADKSIPLQYTKVLQVLVVVLIPLGAGLLIRRKRPAWAANAVVPMKRISILFLLVLAGSALYNERTRMAQAIQDLGLVVLIFNLVSLALAYFCSRAMRLGRPQVIAITIEVGLHNCTIALAVAMSPFLLNNMEIAIPAILYAISMNITCGLVAYLFARQSKIA